MNVTHLLLAADADAAEEHVLLGFYSSRALRRLVLECRSREHAAVMSQQLWSGALKGRCKQWLSTPAEKARRCP